MANFEFNALKTGLGTITVYVGGTTSTTTLDANLVNISQLEYDFSDLESFQLGNVNLTFSDFNDDIRTNLTSIDEQSWLIDVDGTKYFEGLPMKSSMTFSDGMDDSSNEIGIFSVTLGSQLLDTSGTYSGLTSYDTNYYSLSDVLEQTVKNNTSITTFSYLSTFSYSANSETVYLDKDDAGASDAFIVVLKSAVNENTDLNGVLNYLGARLAIWKNTCYIWMKNYTGDTQVIDDTAIRNKITYLPAQKLNDFFNTSTMKLNNGYKRFSYISSSINSESVEIPRGVDYSDASTRIATGDDNFPIWNAHVLGNWTTSYTTNFIGAGDSNGVANLTDIYGNSSNWMQFVIFFPTETSTLTLSSVDFLNNLSDGDRIRVSFEAMVYATNTAHNLDDEYSITFAVGTSELATQSVKSGIDNDVLPYQGAVERFEFDYDIESTGDIVLGFTTTDSGYTSTVTSGVTIEYDGADTILTKTLITNELNTGEYVLVYNATQSAFDGVYKVVSFPTANTAELDLDPYTTDTNTYTCDFRYEPIFISLCNLNIGRISSEDKLIDIFDKDKEDKVTPRPFSYEKGGSAVENEEFNTELRYDVLTDAALANTNIFSTNTDTKRLIFEIDDNTINPYSSISFTEYSVTDGYIEKFAFDFNKGTTTLGVIK